jgi:hypothetical protein
MFDVFHMINQIGYNIRDHKDLLYVFLTIIATIFIPFIIYFYQEIQKDRNFKDIDLLIFKTYEFNIVEIIIWFFIVIFSLFFWNSSDTYTVSGFVRNIFISLITFTVYIFLIRKLKKISDFDKFLNKSSKDERNINIRINYIKKHLAIDISQVYIWENILRSDYYNNSYFFQEVTSILFSTN